MVVEILCGYFRCNLNGSSFVRDAQRSPCKEEAFRLPYVKYSTGANRTTRTVYRALGKPDQAAARRAFLTGRTIGEWHTETKCLFRRVSAISYPSASFLPILFWQDRKERAAGGIPHGWCRKNRLPEVSCAIPAQKSMYSACKIKKPSQDKPTTVGRG